MRSALSFDVQRPTTGEDEVVNIGMRFNLRQHRFIMGITGMVFGLIGAIHAQQWKTSRFGEGQHALSTCREPFIETG